MKKNIILVALLSASFALGFTVNQVITTHSSDSVSKGRVTGIGGIFFKSKDPKKLREWYAQNLGINVNKYGSVFEWRQATDSSRKGFSQWSLFGEKTTYFEPSSKEFMINYRVENMDELVAELRKNGVTVTDSIQSFSYGKFVHIMDPESNKLELWEANDLEYEKMGVQMGLKTTK